jgi:hypothetical protein
MERLRLRQMVGFPTTTRLSAMPDRFAPNTDCPHPGYQDFCPVLAAPTSINCIVMRDRKKLSLI